MNATLIGVDPQTADLSTQAVNLGWPDATIKVATTAVEGLERVERESPDVVLLHTDITDMAWGTIILELRRLTDSPILVLGHSRDSVEVVTAFESGADDYVRLPCNPNEIRMRILALLRRLGHGSFPRALSSGRLSINPAPAPGGFLL